MMLSLEKNIVFVIYIIFIYIIACVVIFLE